MTRGRTIGESLSLSEVACYLLEYAQYFAQAKDVTSLKI